MNETIVHLLRHGEVHNPHRIIYGRLDGYHLSGLGRRMADIAAEHLGDHPPVDYTDARGTDEAAYAAFFHAMLGRGVALAPGAYEVAFPGLAHDDTVIDQILTAATRAAATLT